MDERNAVFNVTFLHLLGMSHSFSWMRLPKCVSRQSFWPLDHANKSRQSSAYLYEDFWGLSKKCQNFVDFLCHCKQMLICFHNSWRNGAVG